MSSAPGSVPGSLARKAATLGVILSGALTAAPGAETSPPDDLTGVRLEARQRWKVESLLGEVGLRQRNVLDVAFEEDGAAWLAASDGLYRYDGHGVKRLTQRDGLPSSFVRAVCWSREGRLWVGTDRGAAVFDGARFDPTVSLGRLAGPSVRRIRQTSDGALWFCCDRWPDASASGGLTRYDGRSWTRYTKADADALDHVMDFFRDSRGVEFALTQTGLLEKRGDKWFSPLAEAGLEGATDTFWAMAEVAGEGLVASTFTAVFRFAEQRWTCHPYSFPQIFMVTSTREREFLAVGLTGKDHCGFKRWDGQEFRAESELFPMPQVNIVFLQQAPDGSLWAGGYDCLVRWDRSMSRAVPGRGPSSGFTSPGAKPGIRGIQPPTDPRSLVGRETVLLVEDEEQVLQLARRALLQHGYTVLAAQTPEAALALAARHAGPIHLILTDVVMPDMNGKELKERLELGHPELRSLFMSGYTADVIAQHGVLDTAVEFLQKPFTMRTLAERVRAVLDNA